PARRHGARRPGALPHPRRLPVRPALRTPRGRPALWHLAGHGRPDSPGVCGVLMSSVPLSGVLLCFDDERAVAQACADQTGLTLAVVERHRFPDGEVKVRLPEALPPRVVVWRGLHQPNEKLVELMLVARAARHLGAQHLTL